MHVVREMRERTERLPSYYQKLIEINLQLYAV